MKEIIMEGIWVVVGVIVTYYLARRKNAADIKKINAESKKTDAETEAINIENHQNEIELFKKLKEFYKEENKELLAKIEDLQHQVKTLNNLVAELTSNQCKGDACPTRMEYNKILAKRANRKQRIKN